MITKDTGYITRTPWRCTTETNRTVEFADGTPDAEIEAVAESMRSSLYGQVVQVRREGLKLHGYCLCDSSD